MRARLIEHLVQSECTAVVYGTIVLDLGEAAALLMAQLLRKLLYKFEAPFSTMLHLYWYMVATARMVARVAQVSIPRYCTV